VRRRGLLGGKPSACASVRERDYCEQWVADTCVFDSEVCLCELTGYRGTSLDNDFDDVYTWVCYPRGCPSMLPGPASCTTTKRDGTGLECKYGERACTCSAQLGEKSNWVCPMVCPSVLPADHDACIKSSIDPGGDTCTYDSGSCDCRFIDPAKNNDAEWTCTDNASGGAAN
jgi:hypothetical protein